MDLVYIYIITVLASITPVTCINENYENVAESSTDSCKNEVNMTCVPPAKRTCSRSCVQKNGGPFCIRCEMKSNMPKIRGKIVAINTNDSNMRCYRGYKLHVNIRTWEGDKLLHICADPIYIDKGHLPTVNKRLTRITYSEYTSCKGLPHCPKKRYQSNTISQGYGRYENGANDYNSYEHRSTTTSTQSSDASRVTIGYSMIVLALVLGITCRELMNMY
ncbi:uncharacterized protein LOC125653538 [Ostrea edulis]|uniref:uncharacterized protein LOC125653538 n=1 Tax=Ostrea edulis TaxID=37623 RepID=UPI0024AF7694|nr:uncharacterized protein LOC125653538 [Ostrea edulis]